jgi:hypothetical protein
MAVDELESRQAGWKEQCFLRFFWEGNGLRKLLEWVEDVATLNFHQTDGHRHHMAWRCQAQFVLDKQRLTGALEAGHFSGENLAMGNQSDHQTDR